MKKSYFEAQRRKAQPEQYKHDLGQHFLYDRALLERLVQKTGITREDDVLEIGSGEGTLTEVLCENARRVASVEVDEVLIPLLHLMQERHSNLDLFQGDIRKLPFDSITASLQKPFYVIANIPYNITTPILELLWKHVGDCRSIALMVQKEVAQKLAALPGESSYGMLSVMTAYYAECEIAELIPAQCFTPPPKVDSAFVIMTPRSSPLLPAEEQAFLFKLIRVGYSQKRKTLCNSLKTLFHEADLPGAMEACGLNKLCRPQELSLADWLSLSTCLGEKKGAENSAQK